MIAQNKTYLQVNKLLGYCYEYLIIKIVIPKSNYLRGMETGSTAHSEIYTFLIDNRYESQCKILP